MFEKLSSADKVFFAYDELQFDGEDKLACYDKAIHIADTICGICTSRTTGVDTPRGHVYNASYSFPDGSICQVTYDGVIV